MKRITVYIISCFYFLFTSCGTASPEKYFGLAVLNSNMMMGFANEGLQRELDQPSGKMSETNKDLVVPMKRKEIIDTKIKFLEEEFEKLKQLKETGDSKDIMQASLALNEYILPVYKTEYRQLAKLYDDEAPKEEIQIFSKAIHEKYYAHFDELYNKLIAAGKLYAQKHNIKVNWAN